MINKNIIFEGVNGCGKSTLISMLKKSYDDNLKIISDIDLDSPFFNVLQNMFASSPFLEMKKILTHH